MAVVLLCVPYAERRLSFTDSRHRSESSYLWSSIGLDYRILAPPDSFWYHKLQVGSDGLDVSFFISQCNPFLISIKWERALYRQYYRLSDWLNVGWCCPPVVLDSSTGSSGRRGSWYGVIRVVRGLNCHEPYCQYHLFWVIPRIVLTVMLDTLDFAP